MLFLISLGIYGDLVSGNIIGGRARKGRKTRHGLDGNNNGKSQSGQAGFLRTSSTAASALLSWWFNHVGDCLSQLFPSSLLIRRKKKRLRRRAVKQRKRGKSWRNTAKRLTEPYFVPILLVVLIRSGRLNFFDNVCWDFVLSVYIYTWLTGWRQLAPPSLYFSINEPTDPLVSFFSFIT